MPLPSMLHWGDRSNIQENLAATKSTDRDKVSMILLNVEQTIKQKPAMYKDFIDVLKDMSECGITSGMVT